jgi:4a-hydroxytetrahydrobiopterin dehydratase
VRPPVLTADEVAAALTGRPGWSGDTGRITRTVRVAPDGAAAVLEAVQRVADELDHHPVVRQDGDDVTFTVWTHWLGGVTAKDFALAQAIDSVLAGAGGSR